MEFEFVPVLSGNSNYKNHEPDLCIGLSGGRDLDTWSDGEEFPEREIDKLWKIDVLWT